MPKKFRVKPTKTQAFMVGLMVIAFSAMLLWVVPEMVGVFSPAAEDTYSEFIWDLPFWAVVVVVLLQCAAGLLLIGSSWHFLEGYGRRRRIEKGEDVRG